MEHKKLYITLLIIFIIVLCIGGTFALVTTISNAINVTQIKAGNLTMTISGGTSENVSFAPSECTGDSAIKKTIVAKATNTSGGKVSFSIGLNITALSDTYKKDTIRYALSTNADSCAVGIIAGGDFKDKSVGDEVWLIKNDYDNITKSGNTYTKTYYLYIWLDKSETEHFDGNISVKLKGSSSNNPNLPVADDYNDGNGTNTLFYKIKNNADKYTRIDFSKTSATSNTNGIYVTTNTYNGVPVYYYRGNVDNHVLFANYCWRIVRTTETGGVKLIYDGEPSNGQCNNTGEATTIGSSAFNSSSSSPADVGYMYGTRYTYKDKNMSSLSGSIVFGNDITYANGTYTLKDTYTLTDVSNWSTEYSTMASKYHYTCFTSSNTCEKVNYIYYINSDTAKTQYYFELSSGKNHLDILKETLDNSLNNNSSKMKTTIDTWYKTNMTDYTSQLEDTVFCNDRSYDVSKSGWDKDYRNYFNYLHFNAYQRISSYRPTLVCANTNDKFTVEASNGNGALDYPVGLLTADEIMYAGATASSNSSFYLYTGQAYWALSPYFFSAGAIGFNLDSAGRLTINYVSNSEGVRPVISLKPKTEFTGSGTATDPFIIK